MATSKHFRIERPAIADPGTGVAGGAVALAAGPVVGSRTRGAIRAALVAGTGLRRAVVELEAVLADTARAAHAILAAIEEIDGATDRLRVAGSSPVGHDALDDIAERSLMIIQACDFQDLTGQRIGNVIGLFVDLEARLSQVRALIDEDDAHGGEAVHPRRTNASELENGPRLQSDDGHLTQGQIDVMFDDG